MAKKAYYAVVYGNEPGVYETWEECQKQISGYSGAVFKKFKTLDEAENFISTYEEDIVEGERNEEKNEIEDYDLEVERDLNDNRVVIFTDGSYSGGEKQASGYGCVIITPEREEYNGPKILDTKKGDVKVGL